MNTARGLAALLTASVIGLTSAGCAAPVAAAGDVHRVEVTYVDGAPLGGVVQASVPLGSTVQLVFSSDVDEDLHLHGYHHHVLADAGGTASVTFTADLPGVFEAEAESVHVPLARLQVG